MMAHIAVHAGIEIEVVEVVMREEVEQFGAGHLFGVSSGLAQDTQDTRTATVLGGRDLLQIIERPVHFIAVDVIYLHAFGARSDEGLPHEMMTETAGEVRHNWISATGFMVLHSGTEPILELAAIGIVEAAVCAAEKGLATYAFRWHLFVNRRPLLGPPLKGRKKIYITHNTANRGMRFSHCESLPFSNWRCKSRHKKNEPRISGLVWE